MLCVVMDIFGLVAIVGCLSGCLCIFYFCFALNYCSCCKLAGLQIENLGALGLTIFTRIPHQLPNRLQRRFESFILLPLILDLIN